MKVTATNALAPYISGLYERGRSFHRMDVIKRGYNNDAVPETCPRV